MKPAYENENIALYPFTEQWARREEYKSWFHDPDVTRYNSHGLFPYTEAQVKAFLDSLNNNTQAVFAILGKASWAKHSNKENIHINWVSCGGKYIGNVSLQRIDWINRSAEFAIVIGDTEWWRKGIGKASCEFMLNHGFNKLNLNRVWTGTAAANTAMIHIALSCGFTEEGRFKNAIWLDGEWMDVIEFGIIKKNYLGKRVTNAIGKNIDKES